MNSNCVHVTFADPVASYLVSQRPALTCGLKAEIAKRHMLGLGWGVGWGKWGVGVGPGQGPGPRAVSARFHKHSVPTKQEATFPAEAAKHLWVDGMPA